MRPARPARFRDFTPARHSVAAGSSGRHRGCPTRRAGVFRAGRTSAFCEAGGGMAGKRPLKWDGGWRGPCAFSARAVTAPSPLLQPPFCLCRAQRGPPRCLRRRERTVGTVRRHGASLAPWLALFLCKPCDRRIGATGSALSLPPAPRPDQSSSASNSLSSVSNNAARSSSHLAGCVALCTSRSFSILTWV